MSSVYLFCLLDPAVTDRNRKAAVAPSTGIIRDEAQFRYVGHSRSMKLKFYITFVSFHSWRAVETKKRQVTYLFT